MADKPKLTLSKPLNRQKQSQLFEALKPLHEQTEKERKEQEKTKLLKEREIRQKKKEVIKRTLAWLNEKFPACFNQKEIKPLKINIHYDIYPFLNNGDAPSKAQLRDALTFYVRNIHYLKAVIKSTHRVDLDGNTCEEITQQQKDHAQENLGKALQYMKDKKEKAVKSSYHNSL